VISGTVRFRVGTETSELGPGGTWRIPSNTPHEVHTGPDGAVVIDVFAPVRADWDELEKLDPRKPAWP
jgi:quercetin dioxygenase-like cupin family protein